MESFRRNNILHILQAIKRGGIKYTDLFSDGPLYEFDTMSKLIRRFDVLYLVNAMSYQLNGYDELPFRVKTMLSEGLLEFVLQYTDEGKHIDEEDPQNLIAERVVRDNPLDTLRLDNLPSILRAIKEDNLTYNDLFYGGPNSEYETMDFLIKKYRFLPIVINKSLTRNVNLSHRQEQILRRGINNFVKLYGYVID